MLNDNKFFSKLFVEDNPGVGDPNDKGLAGLRKTGPTLGEWPVRVVTSIYSCGEQSFR